MVYIKGNSGRFFMRLQMEATESDVQLRICFTLLGEPSTVGSKVNWRGRERSKMYEGRREREREGGGVAGLHRKGVYPEVKRIEGAGEGKEKGINSRRGEAGGTLTDAGNSSKRHQISFN